MFRIRQMIWTLFVIATLAGCGLEVERNGTRYGRSELSGLPAPEGAELRCPLFDQLPSAADMTRADHVAMLNDQFKAAIEELKTQLPSMSLEEVMDQHRCAKLLPPHFYLALDTLPEADVEGSKKYLTDTTTIMFDWARTIGGEVKRRIKTMTLRELVNNTQLYERLQDEFLPVTLSGLGDFIATAQLPEETDTIINLAYHLRVRANIIAPFQIVTDLAHAVEQQKDPERQALMIRVAAIQLLKNGFMYTPRGHYSRVTSVKLNPMNMPPQLAEDNEKEHGGRWNPFEWNRELNRKIAILEQYKDVTLADVFVRFEAELEQRQIGNAAVLVEDAKTAAIDTYEQGYRDGPFELQEGDVLVKPVFVGVGDLFNRLVGVKSYVGHSTVITRFEQAGFPIYAQTEMLTSFSESSVMDALEEAIVYRPNFPMQAGFTETAMNRLLKMGNILYDASFVDGIRDWKGRPALYCTELVHDLFKNGFDENGTQFGPSPFDSVRKSYRPEDAQIFANVQRLGLSESPNYYVPDALIYSGELNFVGYVVTYQESADPKTLELRALQSELRQKFHDRTIQLLHERPIRHINKLEQAIIGGILQLGSLTGMTAAVDSLSIPNGEGRYYFLKFAKIYLDMETYIRSMTYLDLQGATKPHWQQDARADFDRKVMGDIERFFD